MWDPFEDNHRKGLLRNKFGVMDQKRLKGLEFFSIEQNMQKALSVLKREKQIDLRSWRRTHAILLGTLYPWAGTIRHLDVRKGPVRFNTVPLIERETNRIFAKAAQPDFLTANLGYIYGELAFNHPFIDGNGRSLNTVFSELTRRNGFSICWNEVVKEDYLKHLTKAIVDAEYDDLNSYFNSLVVGIETLDMQQKRLLGAAAVAK